MKRTASVQIPENLTTTEADGTLSPNAIGIASISGWLLAHGIRYFKVDGDSDQGFGIRFTEGPVARPGDYIVLTEHGPEVHAKHHYEKNLRNRTRMFRVVRETDVTGISGTGVVAEGIEFSDGSVALRWVDIDHESENYKRGVRPTTVLHESIESVEALHGHNGATRIEWVY